MKNQIKYIARKNLNTDAYDACVLTSSYSRVYAMSWFLDLVADRWGALVCNDYEAVMPLSYGSKWGLKYVYPPCWSQQLGVFTKKKSARLDLFFIDNIPFWFIKVTQYLHSGMQVNSPSIIRKNYILNLSFSFDQIQNNWNKNRKRVLKKCLTLHPVLDTQVSSSEFLSFYNEVPKYKPTTKKCLNALNLLVYSSNEAVHLWGVRINGELQSTLCWIHDKNRIYYLVPVTSEKGKANGAATFLIAKLIASHAGNNLLLDFEGSMDEGVARFYKSFGAIEEHYSVLTSGWFK